MDKRHDDGLRDDVIRSATVSLKLLDGTLSGKHNGFGVPDPVLVEAKHHIEELRELLADAPVVLRNRAIAEETARHMRFREGEKRLWEQKTKDIVSMSQWGMFLNGEVAKLPEGRSKAQRAQLAQLRAEVDELYRPGGKAAA